MRILYRGFPILLFLITIAGITGCNKLWSAVGTVDGDGKIHKEERQVGSFKGVDLEGSYEVILTQAPTSSVQIETDNNLLSHIQTKVEGGKLVVSTDGSVHTSNGIKLFISSPDFQSIEIEGLADVHATTPITSDDLNLDLTGAGSFDLEVHVKHLRTDVEGSGKVTLRGDAQVHSVDISGSGDLKAASMPTDSTKIDVSGSGDAEVFVDKHLTASISGSGNVRYKGSATDIHSEVNGSGSIEKLEPH